MWCNTTTRTCTSSVSPNNPARNGSSTRRDRSPATPPRPAPPAAPSSETSTTGSSNTHLVHTQHALAGRAVLVLGEDGAQALVPAHHILQAPQPAPPDPVPRPAGARSGMLYVDAPAPSNRLRNHNRRCANDNGTTSGRTTGTNADPRHLQHPTTARPAAPPTAPRTTTEPEPRHPAACEHG